jgi:mono/diheme cytochrome c family protein
MGRFLLGFLTAFLLIAILGWSYISLGLAPVATNSPPLPFETTIAKTALRKTVAREMPAQVPLQPSEENLQAGARTYRVQCAVCHGLPDQSPTAIAKGEFPKPPELFKKKGVTDDPPGETYWKVANGIRLTGMPGFKASLSEEQMWQVTLLLANADKLSDAVQSILRAPLPQ